MVTDRMANPLQYNSLSKEAKPMFKCEEEYNVFLNKIYSDDNEVTRKIRDSINQTMKEGQPVFKKPQMTKSKKSLENRRIYCSLKKMSLKVGCKNYVSLVRQVFIFLQYHISYKFSNMQFNKPIGLTVHTSSFRTVIKKNNHLFYSYVFVIYTGISVVQSRNKSKRT